MSLPKQNSGGLLSVVVSASMQEEAAALRASLGRPALHPASAVTAKRADLSDRPAGGGAGDAGGPARRSPRAGGPPA